MCAQKECENQLQVSFLARRLKLAEAGLGDSEAGKGKSISEEVKINWMYSTLGIIDNKASGLMRLNSIYIAIQFFGFRELKSVGLKHGNFYSATFLLAAAAVTLLSIISLSLCLFIVRIAWPFLGKVEGNEKKPFNLEICALDKSISARTNKYRCAWFLAASATGILVIEVLAMALLMYPSLPQ